MRRAAALAPILAALALPATAGAEPLLYGCNFDRETLSFAGTPVEQAACLLRKVGPLGVKHDQPLPPLFRRLLAAPGAPGPGARARAMAALPQPYRAYAEAHAADPAARTAAGLPLAYFVIHDTSTPLLGAAPFPRWLDRDALVNDFTPYIVPQPVAHIFLSRWGQIWAGHDLAEPWRATKLESRVVGPASRGRFVHIETIQPRRFIAGTHSEESTEGPRPGFSKAQYRMLAALYVYFSGRAGHWLIPAQHATVDDGIPQAHDDPQNFSVERFAREVGKLVSADQPRP
ncbi:MAG: hypothetical protein JSS36_10905 [Proteobacteria bacterium]|nr:hypothetical protein [Pseudomonadota bacterium]